jgi:hypothetical protein
MGGWRWEYRALNGIASGPCAASRRRASSLRTTTKPGLAPRPRSPAHSQRRRTLCVPKISSVLFDQVIFVDQTTDTSLFSDAVLVKIDWLG